MNKIERREAEGRELEGFSGRGKAKARNITRGHILLKSAEGWTIERSAETVMTSAATVSNGRPGYHAAGLEGVLQDKVQAKCRRALGGTEEAVLVAIACSPVPEGHDHWTLRMLHNNLIELEVVEHVSAATSQDRLKTMNVSRGNVNRGVSPRK